MTMDEKRSIRLELAAALRSMTTEGRAAAAEVIGAALDRLLSIAVAAATRNGLIMGYLALPREVDLEAPMGRWLRRGHGLVVPRVGMPPRDAPHSATNADSADIAVDRGRIVPVRVESLEPSHFTIDRFGVRSPTHGAVVDPASIDVILVPGLGFDRNGRRLGRGGGHYDRFLGELPPTTPRLGICFARQVLDSIPEEPHDARVDVVVSDASVTYTPRNPQALRSFGQGLADDAASGR